MAFQEEITAFVHQYTEEGFLSNDSETDDLPPEILDAPLLGPEDGLRDWVASELDAPEGFADGLVRISRALKSQHLHELLKAIAKGIVDRHGHSPAGVPASFGCALSTSIDMFYHEPGAVEVVEEVVSGVIAPLMSSIGVHTVHIDPTYDLVREEPVEPGDWATYGIRRAATSV
jgi:hypothetical protein